MLQASDLKKNITFVYQNELWKVLDYKHTHMGRGSADVRVKIKNQTNGTIKSQAFSPNERFEEAEIIKQPLQYLFQEDDELVFMHPVSFEQIRIAKSVVGEVAVKFLKEGEEIPVLFWDEKAIDIDLPPKVVLEVIECDPGVKGNSAANIYKSAKLENGIVTKVPLFIKAGEKIKVDTRNGEYVERAGK